MFRIPYLEVSGDSVDPGRYTNWGLRREVQSFLDEHAEYLPQGWEESLERASTWGRLGKSVSGVEKFAVEKKNDE